MKNIVRTILCALVLSLALTACGGNAAPAATEGADSATQQSGGGYTFTLKGVDISVNADMEPLAQQLGEPADYFESESCAFQGLDKVYTYGSVVISTYPKSGKDYVLVIELKDDTVSTAEGVSIGDSKDTVTAAYGTPTKESAAALSYEKGDCVLAFLLDGDTVSGITYTSATATN